MAAENQARKRFTWNEQLSTIALREIYFSKPYQFVAGSTESAESWRLCVAELIKHKPVQFANLTVEKLRDHVRTALTKRTTVVRALEKQSGIVETETEIKKLMDDIIAERDDYLGQQTTKKENEKKSEAAKEEKGKDVRMEAMESIGTTNKRKSENGESSDSKKKKERRSSNDMLGFLEKRSVERQAAMEAELKIREKEAENRKEESKAVTGGILQMMTVMQEQINQNRQREEQDRREREEERRLQRDQQQQQSQQLTALLGALINKLDK